MYMSILSSHVSPSPMMPPLHTSSPASNGPFDRLDLVVVRVGGADVREVAAGGFQIVVVTGDARRLQLLAMLFGEKTVRGAQGDAALGGNVSVAGAELFHVRIRQPFAGSDNGVAQDSLVFIVSWLPPAALRRSAGGIPPQPWSSARTGRSICSSPSIAARPLMMVQRSKTFPQKCLRMALAAGTILPAAPGAGPVVLLWCMFRPGAPWKEGKK